MRVLGECGDVLEQASIDEAYWIVQRPGAFALFHDSFNLNPSIYLDRCIFKWKI
jgi:hypothetical protein